MRRFVLLDRDGTIVTERHYLTEPDGLELLPSAASGLLRLMDLNVGLIVVTNQSAIGRGMMDEARLQVIHQRLGELLGAEGVSLDGIYHCPHTPNDRCRCRKPAPGMVEAASQDFGFDPRSSFMVGDKACDIELGRAVGSTTVLVRTGYGRRQEATEGVTADIVVDDLMLAALRIEELITSDRTQE